MRHSLAAAALLLLACGTTPTATPVPEDEGPEVALAGEGEACESDADCGFGLTCVEDCGTAALRGARELMAQAAACPSVCRPVEARAPVEPEEPVIPEEPATAALEADQRDYFVLGVLVIAIVDLQDSDLPRAKRDMQRVLELMERYGIGGEAKTHADKVVEDLTGSLFASMRVSANLTLLSGEIEGHAPNPKLRAVYLAARQSTIIYSYLAKGDKAAAEGLWRSLAPQRTAAACRATGADPRIVAFMDGVVDRWERTDHRGLVEHYESSPLPGM